MALHVREAKVSTLISLAISFSATGRNRSAWVCNVNSSILVSSHSSTGVVGAGAPLVVSPLGCAEVEDTESAAVSVDGSGSGSADGTTFLGTDCRFPSI